MLNRLVIIILIYVLLSAISCRNNPVETNDTGTPGRRDYVWTVDTLSYPPSNIFVPTRIWGSSANDIWMTGSGDAGCVLWHYDGTTWERDQNRYLIDPSSIWGTSSNNIWLGNRNSTIWHYDGESWTKYTDLKVDDYQRILIENIWGTSTNDIYGVGFADLSRSGNEAKAIVIHFNGTIWDYVSIPDTKVSLSDLGGQASSGLICIEGIDYIPQFGSISKLFLLYNNTLNEIFSSTDYYATVNEINGEIYCAYGKKVYKIVKSQLVLWKDLSGSTFLGKIWGRSEKDFFSFADSGVGHFNGANFETLFRVNDDVSVSNGAVFNEDVFFPCYSLSGKKSTVIHGKLEKSIGGN